MKEGSIIPALTYFPPLTPVVISRIKQGCDGSGGGVISWRGYDRDLFLPLTLADVRGETSLYMSRRGKTNSLYGNQIILALDLERLKFLEALDGMIVPLLSGLAGPALLNVEWLLPQYGMVDFYWYSTDSYAHMYGLKAQREKLHEFDHYFGRLDRRLGDDVNIIIYSDHGMRFESYNSPEELIREKAGKNFIKYTYPGIYLDEGANISTLAEKLARSQDIFLALYRQDEKIIGYHDRGKISIASPGAGYISYKPGDYDPFYYDDLDLYDRWLSSGEWLKSTSFLQYPAAPASIYMHMQNPAAGDIIIVSQPGSRENGEGPGDHLTLDRLDMTVPVLVRGPDLKHLYHLPDMWLKDLGGDISGFSLEGFLASPSRDSHNFAIYFRSSAAGSIRDRILKTEGGESSAAEVELKFSYSPLYRLRLGGRIGVDMDIESFPEVKSGALRGEWDVFSSYLSRLWLGPEYLFGYGKDGAGLRASAELTLGRADMSFSWHLRPGFQKFSHSLGLKLSPELSLHLRDFSSLGFSYRF